MKINTDTTLKIKKRLHAKVRKFCDLNGYRIQPWVERTIAQALKPIKIKFNGDASPMKQSFDELKGKLELLERNQ